MPTRKKTIRLICILGALGALGAPIAGASPQTSPVAILIDDLPGFDKASAQFLATALRSEGLKVVPLTADAASDSATLSPARFSLYVIPNAKVYPASGRKALAAYLKAGGNLMILGGPAFSEPVWEHKGQWVNEEIIQQDLATRKPDHIVFDFDRDATPPSWPRGTDQADAPGGIEVVPGGPSATGKCLKVWTEDLTGWDTSGPNTIPGFYPQGHGLLCFWGKGDATTTQMVIELKETDHSRWMASVALTTESVSYTHLTLPTILRV